MQIWPAPAKLNLFLHITGQRDDGYHLLQSVFQFLDYSDRLSFDIRNDAEIHRVTDIAGVDEASDLTVRAATLLQQTANIKQGVNIHIDKNLPMGGGVGGGSSDAATTLVALNYLWNAGLSLNQLAQLGLQLGADVPVFVKGEAAFAEGVGEQLQAIELAEPWFLVVKPPVHVSTAEIFSDPQLTRNCPAIKICDLRAGAISSADLSNVCEPVAISYYPEIGEVIDALHQYGQARMTGTGACVFVGFDTQAQARQAQQALPGHWESFVAKAMNTSPLHQVLNDQMQK
ncbi:MAG: 4-(cytidine 5'-diphospho)-2-C-methyl-D-erythritol kinase [Gammaproteobacteria bacterium]|nr:4-(cytidine 5'-diphospho)-2-C-methyl-D-erythritol kinase [Gammaproteobacteria bacterium]MCW9005053.1 4-(cytidine 5'-diphospho)-2-C-methyl-D-erythritol kinase [Gammaproteobacteria bacterium]MCW9056806.1 4-(cytidine 5'-diphospho)-2-C-methyl-D-erythritol kinase [Gammaproteobacteria bacterium]